MVVQILAVHPAVTMIDADGQQREVPTSWFPATPKIGQSWDLQLQTVHTAADQYSLLNQYLRRG